MKTLSDWNREIGAQIRGQFGIDQGNRMLVAIANASRRDL